MKESNLPDAHAWQIYSLPVLHRRLMRVLTHFNALYLRSMTPEDFAKVAEPYIRQTVKAEHLSVPAIAALDRKSTRLNSSHQD